MGNFRGNTYGLGHVPPVTSKDSDFWIFSWDEMGQYDLEATINKALSVSNANSLYYMGHSEGTLTAFAKFSEDLEFAKKIKMFFALGPVATVKYIKGALHYIAPYSNDISWILGFFGADQFLPNDTLMKILAKLFCGGSSLGDTACEDILFLIAGPNSKQFNKTRIPVYISHTPAGTSTQNIQHFGQMVMSGLFQKFDYGNNCWLKKMCNKRAYGQKTPPVYDLTRMTTPTVLYYGDLDWLADPTDIENSIVPYVQNLVGNHLLADFNHLDFIWGMKAASQVYLPIVNAVKANEGIA